MNAQDLRARPDDSIDDAIPGHGTQPDPYGEPRFRRAVRRKVGAILRARHQPAARHETQANYETNLRPASSMAPARADAVPGAPEPPPVVPADFGILMEALELEEWPVDAASLGEA